MDDIGYWYPVSFSDQTINSKLPPQIFYRRKKAITEPGKLSKTTGFGSTWPENNTMGFDGQFIAIKAPRSSQKVVKSKGNQNGLN